VVVVLVLVVLGSGAFACSVGLGAGAGVVVLVVVGSGVEAGGGGTWTEEEEGAGEGEDLTLLLTGWKKCAGGLVLVLVLVVEVVGGTNPSETQMVSVTATTSVSTAHSVTHFIAWSRLCWCRWACLCGWARAVEARRERMMVVDFMMFVDGGNGLILCCLVLSLLLFLQEWRLSLVDSRAEGRMKALRKGISKWMNLNGYKECWFAMCQIQIPKSVELVLVGERVGCWKGKDRLEW
jgi:hypothetical protein